MSDNKYTTTEVYTLDNGVKAIVHVHRPVLTQEEYDRRMARIKRAAENVLIDLYKQKEKNEQTNMKTNMSR